MNSTFHQTLLTLALCDLVFLGFTLCDHFVDKTAPIYILLFPYVWNPLKNILMSWETFLLMSIATERFLAVCHPLVYRAHKVRHSPRVHMMTYIMPSVLLSFIINIPKFFEIKFVTSNITNEENITHEEITSYKATDFR